MLRLVFLLTFCNGNLSEVYHMILWLLERQAGCDLTFPESLGHHSDRLLLYIQPLIECQVPWAYSGRQNPHAGMAPETIL